MKLAKIAGLGAAIGYGSLYLLFPLLREDSKELIHAGKRLLRITSTSIKIGLNYIGGVTPEKHLKNSKLLYEALKSNGGCYVKCGQVIALLDLVVPQEYSDVMKPLLNQAPVSEFSSVKKIIENDFSSNLYDIFQEFEEKPIASASLAQVHRAKLVTGQEVAVKVQHKWIKEQYPGDIKILEILAKLGNRLFRDFDYLWVIEDLKKSSQMELDFQVEAENAIKCSKLFENDPLVCIPKICTKYSSQRVLTMEMMTGVKVSDTESIKEMGLDLKDVAYTLSRAFNEMIFVHGFIHCDPHPGNIFVRPVKLGYRTRAQIVILDHGLYKTLSDSTLASYRNMWKSIILQDEPGMKKYSAELGVTSMYPLLAGMMVGRPWDDIMDNTSGLDRLRNARAYEEEREALKNHAQRWHNEINKVLGKMNSDIVLLFKTFEWLRCNDAALGAPINTMEIIANYVTRDESFFIRFWMKIKLFFFNLLSIFRLTSTNNQQF